MKDKRLDKLVPTVEILHVVASDNKFEEPLITDHIIARADIGDTREQLSVIVYTPKAARKNKELLARYIQAAANNFIAELDNIS